ncbi:VENN motif pre-toxin domain-containing protein [Rosenbergiella nectarea]
MQTLQLICEIGNQAADIARTQGEIAGLKAQSDPAALEAARAELMVHGNSHPTSEQVAKQAYQNAKATFGTGSAIQQAITASTAAIQGLAGGDVAKALAGGAAPYLAEEIHKRTTTGDKVNIPANLMAHAVVNAALSLAKGENALAGASSAVTAEAVGLISKAYYDKKPSELDESQKQTISALASLAAGLASGLVGGDTASAVSGMQTGKVTVENNLMGGTEDGQEKFAREHGKNIASCADNPGSASCQKGLAMQDALMVALPAGLGSGILAAATPEIAAAAKAAIQACAGNVVLCLNNAGIQVSEAIVPGGVGVGGAIGIGKTAAEATAAKAEVVAANAAKNGQAINNSSSLDIAEQIGILRDAAKGNKGYFGLGKATANEANVLGEAWVGAGYRISKDGTSWVSADGLRVYRPPSAKPNSTYATTGVQANFEQKLIPGGRPISNGHLDITK